MSDPFQVLKPIPAGPIGCPNAYAAKLGPFPVPVRIAARAYSNHTGGDSSTAWMKLYYDGVLVDDDSKTKKPFSFNFLYDVILDETNGAAFRIELNNTGGAVKDFGLEFTVTPL